MPAGKEPVVCIHFVLLSLPYVPLTDRQIMLYILPPAPSFEKLHLILAMTMSDHAVDSKLESENSCSKKFLTVPLSRTQALWVTEVFRSKTSRKSAYTSKTPALYASWLPITGHYHRVKSISLSLALILFLRVGSPLRL